MASTTTVRGLMESYEHGEIDYPTLLSAMTAHTLALTPHNPHADWAEVYDRAEEMPEDDDSFWITVAGDLGVITEDQEDELYDAWDHGCPDAS